jgi:hypothetical protein
MYRLSSSQSLQASLASAVTTNPVSFSVSYYDVPGQTKPDFSEYRGATENTTISGTTAVTILDAPSQGTQRDVDQIVVYNADTVATTVTVIVDESGTDYPQRKATLNSEDSLVWTPESGWNTVT